MNSARRPKLIMLAVLPIALIALVWLVLSFYAPKSAEAHLNGFSAGNIMSDFVMGNKNTMSEGEIQAFLRSKNHCNDRDTYKAGWYPNVTYHIRDGHFVCMADETFGANGLPADGGTTAAHFIWQAAQDFSINPQVLIVLLQKEQGLITDTWPNYGQYRTATGYGCPDTAACDSQYFGLNNQIRNAARLFRSVLDGGWSNYPAYTTNYIRYSPDASCGGSNVYIENRATSALYRYTPYQPNAGALAAGTGTAPCGAYGNRNFYNYFTDWFGNTAYTTQGSIGVRYNALGGYQSILGAPISNEYTPDGGRTWWQSFEKGAIVGTGATGFWESTGPTRTRWAQLGYQTGIMGFPNGAITDQNNSVAWQSYQHGYIIWSKQSGAWESKGEIRNRWAQLGYQTGIMGFPVGTELSTNNQQIWWQQYQNGHIVGSGKTGYWESKGSIRVFWGSIGYQDGIAGLPTGPERYDTATNTWSQSYQNGTIIVAGNKAQFVKK